MLPNSSPSAPAATITVNSTGDAVANDGRCTLREAMLAANNNTASGATAGECAAGTPGLDNIRFQLATGTNPLIHLTAPLPDFAEPVNLDGAVGGARVHLEFELLPPPTEQFLPDGIVIKGGNSIVQSLIVNGFRNAVRLESNNNVVRNCYLGVQANGSSSAGNTHGLLIFNGSNNVVGGTTAADRNIISGNFRSGIRFLSSGGVIAQQNRISGNYIGVGADGVTAVSNDEGVLLDTANNNFIGGTMPEERNIISGNCVVGVRLINSNANRITGNYLGVAADGATPVANGVCVSGEKIPAAVFFDFGSSSNSVGATTANAANIIANQRSGPGVLVMGGGNSAAKNSILGNSIYGNAGKAIELRNEGANNQQSFPQLSSAGFAGNTLTVQGALNSTPNATFRLEFFGNQQCPATSGEGRTFLGAVNVTTNASGLASINATLTATVATGQRVSATATLFGGTATLDTSEFSPCVATCASALNKTTQNFPASGGGDALAVTGNCAWQAVSSAPAWLQITSGGSGSGNGAISFTVAANIGPQRTATITVNGQAFTITQSGGCAYTISPATQNFGLAGGVGTVNVTAGAGCPWTAVSNAAWLVITAPTGAATGAGGVTFTVTQNTSAARTGTLTIAGQTFTVTQNAGCSYTITPASRDFSELGGTGSVTVTASDAICAWTATSNVPWITINSGANGAGAGAVSYSIAANASFTRTGALTIAGQTHTVREAAGNLRITNLSAASFSAAVLAPESIVAAFGNDLAAATQSALTQPLPTTLAGTTVRVRDSNNAERPAQLFFVSPTQVNYLLPTEAAFGAAQVTIMSSAGNTALGSIVIARPAPGLFALNGTGQGLAAAQALRVRADGRQVFEPVAVRNPSGSDFVAAPIDLGPATEQVFLVLFGTGLRNRNTANPVAARLGGAAAEVVYAGAQGALVGLDQVNVRIPRSLIGRGEIEVIITVDGQPANTVRVNIK